MSEGQGEGELAEEYEMLLSPDDLVNLFSSFPVQDNWQEDGFFLPTPTARTPRHNSNDSRAEDIVKSFLLLTPTVANSESYGEVILSALSGSNPPSRSATENDDVAPRSSAADDTNTHLLDGSSTGQPQLSGIPVHISQQADGLRVRVFPETVEQCGMLQWHSDAAAITRHTIEQVFLSPHPIKLKPIPRRNSLIVSRQRNLARTQFSMHLTDHFS
jgi:hypothetical protein